MNALQQALGGKLAQIAAQRVFRQAELGTELLGHEMAVPRQAIEQEAFAVGR